MPLKSYIVDFSEPVQLAEAYHAYLVNHSFLLRTEDQLALSQRVRIRFNLLSGAGITLTGKVVSEVRPDGFGIQLPETDDAAWLIGQARKAAQKHHPPRQRPASPGQNRGERTRETTGEISGEFSGDISTELSGEISGELSGEMPVRKLTSLTSPRPDSTPPPPERHPVVPPPPSHKFEFSPEVTQRLPQPTSRPHASGPLAEHDASSDEESGEVGFADHEAKPDPTQSGIRKPAVLADPPADVSDHLAPSGEELMRRIRAMDQAVHERANVTIQEPVPKSPPHGPAELPAAQQIPKLSTEAMAFRDRVKKLKQREKLQLAITGGEQIRRILMEQDEPQVHLWIFKNPRLSEPEAVEFSAKPGLSKEAVEFILRSPRWSNVSTVVLNLLLNPRTPASAYQQMILSLHEEDRRRLAGSSIHPPEAVSLARQMLTSK